MRKHILFFILMIYSVSFAQYSDPNLLRVGTHTGNRIGLSFHNDGQIAGILPGIDIRGEWPLGSGENYIGDMIPLIGVEFVNRLGDTLHSVIISRGPRNRQSEEKHPIKGYFWGWNPLGGFLNPNQTSIAMSHLPDSWPIEGWADPVAANWKDNKGVTQWFGYFGRDIKNADQESIFDCDDQWDDEFNFKNYDEAQPIFLPDSTNPTRHGMGLRMRIRGFQWSNFLAEDCMFWLYDISNKSTTIYRKADFGTTVGTLAGGDGDSQDDLGFFDANNWITYSWDSDNRGNKGQKVGYVGYAYLESPGNPYDGIDNDNDSKTGTSPRFVATSFDSVIYKAGDQVVLIDPTTYVRTLHTVTATTDTVYSMGVRFIIEPGVTLFKEGKATIQIVNGREFSIPDVSAYDGIDNDLDGLIDENEAIHYLARFKQGLPGLSYKNYVTGAGVNDLMIDERRDNDIDEDGDWTQAFDDIGIDGLGPGDNGYPGPDFGERNGKPDQGEPNFGRTDPDESDQIGLTGFNFFNQTASPDMTNDSLLWTRMNPGRFDIISPVPQDGDFIYSSGYFPLVPQNGNIDVKERFSMANLFGEDYNDIVSNKQVVQQIYNAGYKFPQPPRKPKITLSQDDGKVVIYWDGTNTETDRDFITKKVDFEGYKIYRSTDAAFTDARTITNGQGILTFDKPMVQYDLVDTISGYFYPSQKLLSQVGGTTFYLGDNTGIVNRFVDSTVTLGQTYFYAVCAYDMGDPKLDIFPTEDPKFIYKSSAGIITVDDNTGYITPGARPVGYEKAKFELKKSPTFKGTGDINIEVVDDKAVRNGFTYRIAFTDTGDAQTTAYWSLIDLQTPDTVYLPATKATVYVNPTQTINLPAGSDTIYVNDLPFKSNGTSYTAPYDSLVNKSSLFSGNTPIHHGFRLQIRNDAVVKLDTVKSKREGFTSEPKAVSFYTFSDSRYPVNTGVKVPNDYSIEFTSDTTLGMSIADTLFPRTILPAKPINFKVHNLTTDQDVDVVFFKQGTISTTYSIVFKENINGVKKRTWRVDLDYSGANASIEKTGKMTLLTTKPFSRTDSLTFTMQGAKINTQAVQNQLDMIKVVPNPYVVTHEAEARLTSTQTSGRGEREIRFTHIPPGSTITIYTVRGERIRTLTTDNLYVGDVYWNLRTEENLDVAFGVYVYVVESPGSGSKIGKFALIK